MRLRPRLTAPLVVPARLLIAALAHRRVVAGLPPTRAHAHLQKWAGVLASPHVLRLLEACATAEDAALGAVLAGRSRDYVRKAVGVCLRATQRWLANTTQVHARRLAAMLLACIRT